MSTMAAVIMRSLGIGCTALTDFSAGHCAELASIAVAFVRAFPHCFVLTNSRDRALTLP